MRYGLREYGASRFGDIPERKRREHAAETDLTHLFFDRAGEGFFIDVGANEPRNFNQTYHLEEHGWHGLLIEPTPALCDRLRAERPGSTVVQAACAGPGAPATAIFYITRNPQQSTLRPDRPDMAPVITAKIEVPVFTLDQIIEQHHVTRVDFVSIDVEGVQLEVLRGFSIQKHRPRLLLIEDHLLDYDTHRHLTRQGYRLVKRTGLNNWYIPRGEPFALTDRRERLALWSKLWLRTPLRAAVMRVKRSRCWPKRRRRASA